MEISVRKTLSCEMCTLTCIQVELERAQPFYAGAMVHTSTGKDQSQLRVTTSKWLEHTHRTNDER